MSYEPAARPVFFRLEMMSNLSSMATRAPNISPIHHAQMLSMPSPDPMLRHWLLSPVEMHPAPDHESYLP